MSVLQLSLNEARHLHLAAQGLLKKPRRRARPKDILSTIQQMSLLQIDTINVVARSPYLVLFSRLGRYPQGWLDEALRYYRTACQMDPTNAEYRQALEYMEGTDDTAYRPGGGSFGTFCGGNPCMSLCCLWALCNGGGYWFCC